LASREAAAVAKAKKGKQRSVFIKDGSSVKRNVWEGFEFLRKHVGMSFPSSHDIVLSFVRGRHRRPRQSESISLKIVASLEEYASLTSNPSVARGIAGAAIALTLGCSRLAQFQRSGIFLPSQFADDGTAGFFSATCLGEKNPSFSYASNWFVPKRGVTGSTTWPDEWLASVNSCRAAIDGYFLLRDFWSPNDDPTHPAAEWTDEPLVDNTRANNAFRAILRVACGVSSDQACLFGSSSFRHFLPNVARVSFESAAAKAELGRWAGSIARTINPTDPYAHIVGSAEACLIELPHRYASASAPAAICAIIRRQIDKCAAVLARRPIQSLPTLGGWGLLCDDGIVDEALLL